MMAKSHYILIPLGCLLLAACGGRSDDDAQLNALDNELASMNDGSPTRDPQLREALKKLGREDIMIVAGGVIPPQDFEALRAAGAAAIFPPGTMVAEAAERFADLW